MCCILCWSSYNHKPLQMHVRQLLASVCADEDGKDVGVSCRVSGAFGWAATLDIMLLFFPVARSTFLHWMLGTSFPALIKYHRCSVLTSH